MGRRGVRGQSSRAPQVCKHVGIQSQRSGKTNCFFLFVDLFVEQKTSNLAPAATFSTGERFSTTSSSSAPIAPSHSGAAPSHSDDVAPSHSDVAPSHSDVRASHSAAPVRRSARSAPKSGLFGLGVRARQHASASRARAAPANQLRARAPAFSDEHFFDLPQLPRPAPEHLLRDVSATLGQRNEALSDLEHAT